MYRGISTMEQKRTLWIIAAAGMFLLVVLGAAFILYSPAQKSAPQTIARNFEIPNTKVQTVQGWTSVPGDSGNQLLPPGEIRTKDLTVYTENTTVYGTESSEGTTIDLSTLKAASEMAPAQETFPQNINITVNIPETKTEIKDIPVKVAESMSESPKDTSTSVVIKNTEPVKQVAKVSAKTPVSSKASSNVKAASPAKKVETKVAETKINQYWVQAAAYSNKKTAENARGVLDENKIPADIFTYQDAKGKVFYRVRVGPYTTKSEAEYWRTKIDKIAAFSKAESYITQN